jgi:hypothetical protein
MSAPKIVCYEQDAFKCDTLKSAALRAMLLKTAGDIILRTLPITPRKGEINDE